MSARRRLRHDIAPPAKQKSKSLVFFFTSIYHIISYHIFIDSVQLYRYNEAKLSYRAIVRGTSSIQALEYGCALPGACESRVFGVKHTATATTMGWTDTIFFPWITYKKYLLHRYYVLYSTKRYFLVCADVIGLYDTTCSYYEVLASWSLRRTNAREKKYSSSTSRATCVSYYIRTSGSYLYID